MIVGPVCAECWLPVSVVVLSVGGENHVDQSLHGILPQQSHYVACPVVPTTRNTLQRASHPDQQMPKNIKNNNGYLTT